MPELTQDRLDRMVANPTAEHALLLREVTKRLNRWAHALEVRRVAREWPALESLPNQMRELGERIERVVNPEVANSRQPERADKLLTAAWETGHCVAPVGQGQGLSRASSPESDTPGEAPAFTCGNAPAAPGNESLADSPGAAAPSDTALVPEGGG